MIKEKELQEAIYKIITENKVPYTDEGFKFIIEELDKNYEPLYYDISVQPIEEMSVEDRQQRKCPKITFKIL